MMPDRDAATDTTAIDCHQAVEFLPWLVNGSLEAGEDRALRDHLDACESCRGELGETVEAWGLATRHIPSLALAEFALGVAPVSLDCERIERHLAACPSCRGELGLIQSDGVVDFEIARTRRPAARRRRRQLPAWREWALAAAVAGVLATGGWTLLRLGPAPSPTAGHLASGSNLEGAEPLGPPRSEPPRAFHTGGVFSDGFESGSVVVWAEFETDEPPI